MWQRNNSVKTVSQRHRLEADAQMESDEMEAHNYELKTAHLLLHLMTIANAVWKWVSDKRVAKYMVYPTYTDKERLSYEIAIHDFV